MRRPTTSAPSAARAREAGPSAGGAAAAAPSIVIGRSEGGQRGEEARRRAGEARVDDGAGCRATRPPVPDTVSSPASPSMPTPSEPQPGRHRDGVVAVGHVRQPALAVGQRRAHERPVGDALRARARRPWHRAGREPAARGTTAIRTSGCTAGRKPRASRPPRYSSAAAASTSTTATPSALERVDDLEAGDVDAELGGQREHLGGGAGTVGDRDADLAPAPRVGDAAGQVGAGLAGPLQPVVSPARSSAPTTSRISVSPAMRPSSAETMAGRFSAQMSSQMSGWPLAMRVMSRKPPAARRSSAACSSARSAASPIRWRR